MKQQRVTAEELFVLADAITKVSGRAAQSIRQRLDEALVPVLDAAKTAAFQEALERHKGGSPSEGDQ